MNIKIDIKIKKRKHKHFIEYDAHCYGNIKIYNVSDGYKIHINNKPYIRFNNKYRAKRFVKFYFYNRFLETLENKCTDK